jgi:hypothetical protein
VALDGIEAQAEPRQDGGLVARARADLEQLHARPDLERLGHARDDDGLAQGLAVADGERHVLVGLVGEELGYEQLARHALDRGKDPRIGNARASQFHDEADLARLVGHASASARRFMVGRWVRSSDSGVTEMAPRAIAARSVPGRAASSSRRKVVIQ